MFPFPFTPKKPRPSHPENQLAREALGSQFSYEEQTRIMALRRQNLVCPESLKLDLSYQRLVFARWLIRHDLLSDEIEAPQRRLPNPPHRQPHAPHVDPSVAKVAMLHVEATP